MDVAVKYLEDHPEIRHRPANSIVMEALSKAFPCKSQWTLPPQALEDLPQPPK